MGSTRTTTSKFAGGGSAWTRARRSRPSQSTSALRTGISGANSASWTWSRARSSRARCSRSIAVRAHDSIRALTFFALDQHADAYEEIRPPSVALTETMMSTGHLPKSADDMYSIERDDLWLIPTAEVPLTSLHRGEILDESALPIRPDGLYAVLSSRGGGRGQGHAGAPPRP